MYIYIYIILISIINMQYHKTPYYDHSIRELGAESARNAESTRGASHYVDSAFFVAYSGSAK